MSDDKIYQCVPQWIVAELRNRFCKGCGQGVDKKDVIAIGVRETSKKNSIFVEHACSNCKKREITSFYKSTLEDLCYTILDSIQQRRDMNKAKEIESKESSQTSQISDEEVKNFIDFINQSESHEEFMKHIRADKFKGIEDEPGKDES